MKITICTENLLIFFKSLDFEIIYWSLHPYFDSSKVFNIHFKIMNCSSKTDTVFFKSGWFFESSDKRRFWSDSNMGNYLPYSHSTVHFHRTGTFGSKLKNAHVVVAINKAFEKALKCTKIWKECWNTLDVIILSAETENFKKSCISSEQPCIFPELLVKGISPGGILWRRRKICDHS